jgi:hypothetical protein
MQGVRQGSAPLPLLRDLHQRGALRERKATTTANRDGPVPEQSLLPWPSRPRRARATQHDHRKEETMTTWQEVEKHWSEFKPKVHTQWPKLSDVEINNIAGKRTVLAKSLETDYKITLAEAEKQIDTFLKTAVLPKTFKK